MHSPCVTLNRFFPILKSRINTLEDHWSFCKFFDVVPQLEYRFNFSETRLEISSEFRNENKLHNLQMTPIEVNEKESKVLNR